MATDIWLERLVRLTEKRYERKSVGEQTLTVSDSAAVNLTVPAKAVTAELQVVDGGSANARKSIAFLVSGTVVTASTGIILGDLAFYEIIGADPMTNFSCIGIEAGKTHTLHVIYYL